MCITTSLIICDTRKNLFLFSVSVYKKKRSLNDTGSYMIKEADKSKHLKYKSGTKIEGIFTLLFFIILYFTLFMLVVKSKTDKLIAQVVDISYHSSKES